jgi:Hemerythrin HHE cation binding domain
MRALAYRQAVSLRTTRFSARPMTILMPSLGMTQHRAVRERDALDLLTRDHDAIRHLFRTYERLVSRPHDADRKSTLVGRLCFALTLHFQIEEDLFYPAVLKAFSADGAVLHAQRDHVGCRELIARLDEMEVGDADFDATVAVLGAYVVPHMDEEQREIFQRVRLIGMDTLALGHRMAQLQRSLGADVTQAGTARFNKPAVAVWPGSFGDMDVGS